LKTGRGAARALKDKADQTPPTAAERGALCLVAQKSRFART